jgi:hypothetical protein
MRSRDLLQIGALAIGLIYGQPLGARARGSWAVQATFLQAPETDVSDHVMKATLTNSLTGLSFEIQTPTFATRIKQQWDGINQVVLIGESDWPDEAIVIDTVSRRVTSRAVGYQMRVMGDRWLVSTEFFPPHLAPESFANDVLLIRDLSGERRGCGAPQEPAPAVTSEFGERFAVLVEAAGVPVYPISNASTCSYENLSRNKTVDSIDGKSMSVLADGSLAFITYSGAEGAADRTGRLVIIPLLSQRSFGQPISELSLDPVYEAIALKSRAPLQVAHLEMLGRSEIKVVLQAGVYSVPFAVVSTK